MRARIGEVLVHLLRLDLGERLFGERRLGAATRDNAVGVAAGKRERGGNSRGRQQGADKGSIQTRYSPEARAVIEQSLALRCGNRKAYQPALGYR